MLLRHNVDRDTIHTALALGRQRVGNVSVIFDQLNLLKRLGHCLVSDRKTWLIVPTLRGLW